VCLAAGVRSFVGGSLERDCRTCQYSYFLPGRLASCQKNAVPQRFAGYSRDGPSAGSDGLKSWCGLTAKAGRPNRQNRSLPCQRRRIDSLHLHRVAIASAESLRPGARGVADTFFYPTRLPLILHLQDSRIRLSKRPDMAKTGAKWAFLAQIVFAGIDTRHPSG
jgi:hypothetical protein